jgi:hypothetical protein
MHGKYSFLAQCFLMLYITCIKSESKFRILNCMLLIFQCLVALLIKGKLRNKISNLLLWVKMSRILLIMHHIALCTPCIALLLVFHTCAFYDRPCRAEIRNSSVAGQKECGGPQVQSCMDTNIAIGSRQVLVHSTNTPCLLFLNLALCYSWLCIKLIEVIWHCSWNKTNLLIYPC